MRLSDRQGLWRFMIVLHPLFPAASPLSSLPPISLAASLCSLLYLFWWSNQASFHIENIAPFHPCMDPNSQNVCVSFQAPKTAVSFIWKLHGIFYLVMYLNSDFFFYIHTLHSISFCGKQHEAIHKKEVRNSKEKELRYEKER